MRHKFTLLASVGSLCLLSTPAAAQTVEDIVVTAQKRSEDLQTVPISIAAVTGDLAAAQGIRTSGDLKMAVAGLNDQNDGSALLFYIRGVGLRSSSAGQEAPIATFIDGVYLPSLTSAEIALNNVERIEVLKGPQGTLYGRNATGGAINIITKTPSHTTSFQGDIGYGNLKTVEGNLYATGGLTEDLAADLAIHVRHMGDGFGRNVITGAEVNKRQDFAIRSKILWTPGDDTSVTLSGDYSKTSGSQGVVTRAAPGSYTLFVGQTGWNYGFWDTTSDQTPVSRIKNFGGSVKIEQDLGFADLISISAYRIARNFQHADDDLSSMNFFNYSLTERTKQFTQEIQLSSSQSEKFKWTVGAFYLDGSANSTPLSVTGAIVAPLAASNVFAKEDTRSIAVYGQASYEVLPGTKITAGLRYTHDKRSIDAHGEIVFPDGTRSTIYTRDEAKSFNKATWRIGIDHTFDNDTLLYATYSRGFKSGTYNTTSPLDPAINPEVLDAFEVGFKSQLLDRRVRLNAAAFYYDYKNIQLSKIEGAALLLLNAASSKIYGVDVDTEVAISDHLTLHAGAEVLHARYKDFEGAPLNNPNTVFPFGNSSGVTDASGNQMVRAPKFTANAAVDYRTDLANGELGINVSYAYNDGFFSDPDNRFRQKAYSLVNSQVTWTSPDGHYTFRIFAKNLFNEKYYLMSSEIFTGDLVTAAEGRTYGGSIGVKF